MHVHDSKTHQVMYTTITFGSLLIDTTTYVVKFYIEPNQI